MTISADNVTLAKLMRKYGNTPAHISATPTSRVVAHVQPVMQREASRDANLAARSYQTGLKARQGREQFALKQRELDAYEDQADKAKNLALADLFLLKPLSFYAGYRADQEAQERHDELMAADKRRYDLMALQYNQNNQAIAEQLKMIENLFKTDTP